MLNNYMNSSTSNQEFIEEFFKFLSFDRYLNQNKNKIETFLIN